MTKQEIRYAALKTAIIFQPEEKYFWEWVLAFETYIREGADKPVIQDNHPDQPA